MGRVEGQEGHRLVPPLHQQTINILNNLLSAAHYLAATRVPGPHRHASFVSAHSYKKVLALMAGLHGGTSHRDLNYFQALHRMLMGEFQTTEDKSACQTELEE
eukprot:UN4214